MNHELHKLKGKQRNESNIPNRPNRVKKWQESQEKNGIPEVCAPVLPCVRVFQAQSGHGPVMHVVYE